MCGFGVSNVIGLTKSNKFCQRRGPDLTNSKIVNGVEFLHNLLHITGNLNPQPLIKDDVVCVFNGEIYNYLSFGNYNSDGDCIIDLYLKLGESFTTHLDGEFAICLIDFKNNKLIISTDTFACKPLWYEFKDNNFCVASYNSQLTSLGFTNGQKLFANSTKVYNLKTLQQISEIKNFVFNTDQYKTSYDGWITAFENSIKKRTANTDKGMFLGLSSGYDSGAIACELEKQKRKFKAYSIINSENLDILNARFKLISNYETIEMNKNEVVRWRNELNNECEEFRYDGYDIKGDQASTGLSAICNRANQEGRRIYFSGQGADEIISDYGWNGKKIFKHSGFGGLFPNDLNGFFPWHSFWDGTQIKYLNKEEYVAGHFGIETRYPFLDKDLVQEFLWLTAELKNKKYKSALDEYLQVNNFPYESEKRGFNVSSKKDKKGKQIK